MSSRIRSAQARRSLRRRHFTSADPLAGLIDLLEKRDLLAANVFKTITIDGNMSDWANVPSYYDAEGNTHDTDHEDPNDTPAYVNHPDVDLLEYKVAYDAENIYFYFRSKGQIGRTQASGPGLSAGRFYTITTIDVDQNDATGYELSGGGYYPTSDGYDVNAEIEHYNGTFNTAHYLNHGASNQTELNEAFLNQSSGLWTSGNDGPYPAGFMTPKFGVYETYTQWVYHDNDTLTFVRDRGPVVNGIASQFISADGHSMETKFPLRGFLKDEFGNPIIGMGSTIDISFSLEASSEFSPDGLWASNTAEPVVGFHLNLPSKDSVAVYRNGKFYVDQNNNSAWNGNSTGNDDSLFNFGTAGDKPLAGDWNADGFDDVGILRGYNWYVDLNGNRTWDGVAGGDAIYAFGTAGDIPVVGDWNKDGRDDIGIFRNGAWYLDQNGNHKWDGVAGGDVMFTFGSAGVKPVVGDWNGDGQDDVGYTSGGKFYLDANGNRLWNGNAGGDQLISFGNASDTPVIGDWNNDNISDIGVFRAGEYLLDRNGNRKWDGNATNADLAFKYGSATDIPVGGRWVRNRVMSTTVSSTSLADSMEQSSATPVVINGETPASNSNPIAPLASQISSSRLNSSELTPDSASTRDSDSTKSGRKKIRHAGKSSEAQLSTSHLDSFFSRVLSTQLG